MVLLFCYVNKWFKIKRGGLRRTQNTTFNQEEIFNPMSIVNEDESDNARKKEAISPRSIMFESTVSIDSSQGKFKKKISFFQLYFFLKNP